jgi:S-adenosyl-L-methionine hydrolase (adenosine-forming)
MTRVLRSESGGNFAVACADSAGDVAATIVAISRSFIPLRYHEWLDQQSLVHNLYTGGRNARGTDWPMRRIITLTTDFGTTDGYVGEVKGVLLSNAPDADIVDITHDIPPQDVERARLTVARIWRRFREGTIHLVIVDPGVGSSRAALAVASDGRFLVGPDNGVLSPALLVPGARVVALSVPTGSSATFHGRDVFAPAAASLALGATIDALGTEARSPIVRRTPEPTRRADGAIEGEVVVVDRFGNAVTNLISLRGGMIEVGSLAIPIRRTYADVKPGEPIAVVGSSGFIEIAIRDGDAARALKLARGTPVILRNA